MKSKQLDLDDIGHIGGGTPPTEEDFRNISAFIQARRAEREAKRKTTSKRPAKRAQVKRSTKNKART